jgi:DNA gyrase subunit A
MLKYYLEHQIEVIQRRTVYDLEKAEARQHILDGLVIALHDVDRAIEIIKQSKTGEEAREALIAEYQLTDIQARAILDMRLQRLTGMEIEKLESELAELVIKIGDYRDIIQSQDRKLDIIRTELLEIRNNYADPRMTEINLHEDLSIEDESLIPVEDVIITVTNNGYIKRMNVDHYKTQNRGGVGMSGIKVHEDDYVEHIRMTSTHDYHLFFTNKGRVYKIKGYKVPEGSRHSKGLPIVNLLEFQKDECLASFTNVKDFEDENAYLTFITKKGIIKRTPIKEYANIRTNGINAINLRDDDELLSVALTDGTKDIILGASNGKAIRFDENDARAMGRTTSGVRAMDLGENDEVVGAAMISSPEDEILVITENGFGKRTIVDEYRKQIRGGKGVKTLNVTEKNGKLSTLRVVSDDQDLIVVSDKGVVIRTHIDQISQTKRATQGVRIIRLRPDHKVSTIALVPRQEEVLEEEITDTFVQESMNVTEPKKTIAAVDLAPEEVEEETKEVVTTDSLFDEE